MKPATSLLFPVLVSLAVAGCTQFPDLDHTQTDALYDADYPALVPIEPILAGITPPGDLPQQTRDDITTRLSALRGRADSLRGDVLRPDERRRLEEGLR